MNLSDALYLTLPALGIGYVLYLILSPRQNVFDSMSKYRPCPVSELPPADKLSKIKRCSKPDEDLEIVYSSKGVGSRETMTITDMFDGAVAKGGNRKIFAVERPKKNSKGERISDEMEWNFISWKEFGQEVELISKAMIAIGIDPFDIVNLLGFCSPEYVMIHLAAMYCGGLPAGIYTTSQPGGIKYITNLCQSKAVFIDTKESLSKYYSILKEIPSLRYIIVYRQTKHDQDLSDIELILKTEYGINNLSKEHDIRILNWNEFLVCGKNADLQLSRHFTNKRLNDRKKDQEATQCCDIVYTSGTTGFSKAVMLSHDNLFFELLSLGLSINDEYGGGEALTHGEEHRTVAFLPLSHVAGQLIYIYWPLFAMNEYEMNVCCYFARYSWKQTLKNTILFAKPTSFTGVPRIWEKFYESMNSGLAQASSTKKKLFNFIIKHGTEMWLNRQIGGSGEIPKLWPFISKYLCDGLIKKKIGFGSCRSFTSGGGVLNKTVRNTFAALNMPILDGYGMTECGGCVCASRLNNLISDSVGPPLEGVEFRIEHVKNRDPIDSKKEKKHGEICFRGRNCMMGYLNEPEKTGKIFDKNGWLHSGDIGYISNNCVYVTGRIKELLVTSGGENIAPIPVENFIRKECSALSQVIMCGDGRKYCSLLCTISCEIDEKYMPNSELQAHALKIDDKCKTVEEAMKSAKWHEYIRNGIKKYNNSKEVCASNAARIQYFQILPKDLNIYDHTLSPTMKLRRHTVNQIYAKYIDLMYPQNTDIKASIPVNV